MTKCPPRFLFLIYRIRSYDTPFLSTLKNSIRTLTTFPVNISFMYRGVCYVLRVACLSTMCAFFMSDVTYATLTLVASCTILCICTSNPKSESFCAHPAIFRNNQACDKSYNQIGYGNYQHNLQPFFHNIFSFIWSYIILFTPSPTHFMSCGLLKFCPIP